MEQLEYDLLSLAINKLNGYLPPDKTVIHEIVHSAHFKLIFDERAVNEALVKMGHPDPHLAHDFMSKNLHDTVLERKFNLKGRYDFVTSELIEAMAPMDTFYLLDEAFPGSAGYLKVARVGFSADNRHALLYLGQHEAWEAANGWFELWSLNQETYTWQFEKLRDCWHS